MKISRPTLLVNEKVVRQNLDRIVEKVRQSGAKLVPHFKTPQSLKIGQWYKEAGIDSITVSSVKMAQYFASDSWKNITIAFPLNILEIDDIVELSKETKLTLLINESKQLEFLNQKAATPADVVIEIDCGSKRSGIDPDNIELIAELIKLLKDSRHNFKGFYSHFGHTYNARSREEIKDIYNSSINILLKLKDTFSSANPQISIGDTPSASVVEKFNHVSSFHAGNFIFYDLMQVQIGACRKQDIAVALACPVVSKNPERNEVVIYGGGIHLSKESMFDDVLGITIYGKPVKINDYGWTETIPGCYVKSLSQEHGVLQLTKEVYDQISVGDIIGILPIHSCMTADAMGEYMDLQGDRVDHM